MADKLVLNCGQCNAVYDAKPWQLARKCYHECPPCRRKRQADYRQQRKASGFPVVSGNMSAEWHREYNAKYFSDPDVMAKRAKLEREYSKKPNVRVKQMARRVTRNAIRRGELNRLPCEVCNTLPTDAHHDDYEKPLDVRWLCRKHHSEHHKNERKATA